MTLDMPRPAIVPFRWLSHGIDIRVSGDGAEPLFNALDICRALDIKIGHGARHPSDNFEPRIFPATTVQVEGAFERDGRPSEFFTVDQVRALADELPMVLQHDFMSWFEQLLEEHPTARLTEVLQGAVPAEPGRSEAVQYDVAQAARILSRDPALEYGQHSLFEAMQGIGWIAKDNNIWIPGRDALQAGWLVRRGRWIPGKKIPYPQVRITETGLRALHTRLGGAAGLALDNHPTPSLLEL